MSSFRAPGGILAGQDTMLSSASMQTPDVYAAMVQAETLIKQRKVNQARQFMTEGSLGCARVFHSLPVR